MRHQVSFWSNPWRPQQDWFDLSPVFDLVQTEEGTRTHIPACEVEEKSDHFLVTLDVPGVSKDDIKIRLEKNRLIVSAERKERKKGEKEATYFSERRYGKFERVFDLSEHVDLEKIEADYRDGVLKIALAKAEKAKPREIAIGTSEKVGLFQPSSGSKEKAVN